MDLASSDWEREILIRQKKNNFYNNSNTQRHIAKIYIEKCQNLLSDEIDIYKELIKRKGKRKGKRE